MSDNFYDDLFAENVNDKDDDDNIEK